MNIYISTPINGRNELTLEDKRKGAMERIEALKQLCKYLAPKEGDRIISTFDLNLEEDVTEGEAMGRCIQAIINDCQIVVMDVGYKNSKGCMVEFYTAKVYGKQVYCYDLRRTSRPRLRIA